MIEKKIFGQIYLFVNELTTILAAFCIALVFSSIALILKPETTRIIPLFFGLSFFSFAVAWATIEISVRVLAKYFFGKTIKKLPTSLFIIPLGSYIFTYFLNMTMFFFQILLIGVIPAIIFYLIAVIILSIWKNSNEPLVLSIKN